MITTLNARRLAAGWTHLARAVMLVGLACHPVAAQTAVAAAQAVVVTPAASQSRFGSLMTDRVEVRSGPGQEHPVTVIFSRAGLPVQLLESAPGWQRIEDREGTSGWARADMVSRRRTALAASDPKDPAGTQIVVRASERATAEAVALLEPGVIVGLIACDGRICTVSASGVRGYVDQRQLWGAPIGEVIR